MTRFNIKWVIDLNLKAKTIKLVKEKNIYFYKENFYYLGVGKDCSGIQSTNHERKKMINYASSKLKSSL